MLLSCLRLAEGNESAFVSKSEPLSTSTFSACWGRFLFKEIFMAFIPNTTPTPNWLYNGEMKKMSETELKVVLLITRKTLGWFDPMTNERKNQDNISQKQFMEFTGKSHTAIAYSIQSSIQHGWIIAKDRNGNLCETSEKRRRRKVWYQLGSVFINKISNEENSLESKQESGLDKNLSNFLTESKQESGLESKQESGQYKRKYTKETIQNSEFLKNSVKCSNPLGHKNCVENIESVIKGFKKRFTNYPKQINALHKIYKAGFTDEEIENCLNKVDEDTFWQDRGWDLMTVANILEKGGKKYVK